MKFRNHLYLLVILALFACTDKQSQQTIATTATSQKVYYPGKGDNWETRKPEQIGMDAALLQQAVAWAETQETTQIQKDFSTQKEIFGEPLGPLPGTRANTNGIILKDGYIVAEWGDTKAADPTYSVAKSFLSTILGLTIDRGMIQTINDPVAKYVKDGGYDSEQNRKVTWEYHARQTSEWEGELWGKKHDFVGKEAFGKGERKPRELQEPGSFYEYNDVRINRFALSLLRLWEKPLPEVLEDEIMDPIDASETWKWVPYRNSVADINGKQMPSVSGGTRWGGGLWISARDEARFGYLFLRNGRWKDKQLVSEKWVKEATTSRGIVGPDYGYLWWLNTEGKAWPDAPTTSYAALGAGQNTVWVDPEHNIVIVWRWHNGNPNEMIKRVLAAVK
ncbi:serine hydrolase [Pontibacter sp. BT310]|uniref:Beta-lactamase family protein n=1 Tax=Pontibacter populi TaxID=890055 RepID=A0ABS6X678_9BACT|nr:MULTISPECIES: serine hydrolase [Pontibacter]MBJ6116641.1 serine hydrolase [Pontibacter sp. BT310]MBR0569065.1 serine hydrolase [Microvirga sp. STS03]MBW3363495.1 beta-lactamase family protein [Pontibacter populi]